VVYFSFATTPAFSIFVVNAEKYFFHINPDYFICVISPEAGYHQTGSKKTMDSFFRLFRGDNPTS
jgi:hypothetical protein